MLIVLLVLLAIAYVCLLSVTIKQCKEIDTLYEMIATLERELQK
jgi:hypothetical protein